MMPPTVRGVLLDIEGTTSSVAYVYEVLFPFARQHLDAHLANQWSEPSTQHALDEIARNAGARSLAHWTSEDSPEAARQRVRAEALRLMEADAKSTGLKELQGLIWRAGFESGQLRSHLFPDVPAALESWAERGIDVRVFSSGSVAAQRLFFGHSEQGDLSRLLSGYYDTTTGPKREPSSYRRIADEMRLPVETIIFLSDVVEELDAASDAGLQTRLVVRPGNAPVAPGHRHPIVHDFVGEFS
jgi:enolase-phosphatase E1